MSTNALTEVQISKVITKCNNLVQSRVVRGDFSVLSFVKPPSYSIFLSSTFIDTQTERNAIMEFVKPRVEDVCKELNIDFHFVDLRWGIRDNAANNHDTTQICMDEIRRCFESSQTALPVFIHLAFDRYGWIPIPSGIFYFHHNWFNTGVFG